VPHRRRTGPGRLNKPPAKSFRGNFPAPIGTENFGKRKNSTTRNLFPVQHKLSTVSIRRAGLEDAPKLVVMLADAFHDDPVMRWWIDDSERAEVLPRVFDVLVRELFFPNGEVYTTDDVAGGALWGAPGRWPIDDERQAEFAHLWLEVLGPHAERGSTLSSLLDKQHPSEPHYYLGVLGVAPQRQCLGIGSALMEPVLAHCDSEGIPGYLEATNPRNRDLYLRHGFVVKQQVRLPDGPPLWLMLREPR
jgi:GNAT superfamily N-acetyltransferase